MKPGAWLLLHLLVAIAGLGLYHHGVAPPERLRALPDARSEHPPAQRTSVGLEERRLDALETGTYLLRRELSDARALAVAGVPRRELLSDARLAPLEASVAVIEERQVAERRTQNLRVAIRQLRVGLTPREVESVLQLVQRSHVELGAYGKKLREEGLSDPQQALATYDAIRLRYHAELRASLTAEQAEAVIAAFVPLR